MANMSDEDLREKFQDMPLEKQQRLKDPTGIMDDKQEILRDFKALPKDGQQRVCDALAEENVKRKFREMPPEKQQTLYDSTVKLFAQLEADWKAKPENAGKTMKYSELWEEHLKKTKEGGPP